MSNTRFIITLFISFFFATSQAQEVVDKTQEKAKEKTEQRLDQRIDQGIDSGLDAIEGLFSKKKNNKKSKEVEAAPEEVEEASDSNDQGTAAMMKMFGNSNVEVKDSYDFDMRFVILMEEFDKKNNLKESNEMAYLGKEGATIMGIEVEQEGIQTQMVYDLNSYEVLTLMQTGGQKIGTTMAIDKNQIDQITSEGESSQKTLLAEMPGFKKTGNSKEISGYSCDEYIVETKEEMDEKITYWITDEADADMSGMNQNMPSVYSGSGYPEDGSIIQIVTEEKGGESYVLTVKEIQTNQNISISTKGYTFMNMPGQ